MEPDASQETALLDASVLRKVLPFFHCQTDYSFLRLPPERPVLGKTSFSQIFSLVCLLGDDGKQQNALGWQPGAVVQQTAGWLSSSDKHNSASAQGAGGCNIKLHFSELSVCGEEVCVLPGAAAPQSRRWLRAVQLYPREQSHISSEAAASLSASFPGSALISITERQAAFVRIARRDTAVLLG